MKRWGSGKNINRRDRHGETPLHKVVTCGTVGEIGRLIRQGADVNARDNTDWTPLHVASLEGLPDAVECLLKAGADVNVSADGGTTPLHDGAISGCRKVVELLLHHGADAYSTDRCGKIPLEVSSSIEVRNCLLDHMRGTKKSSETSHPVSSESASSSHQKVSFIEIYPDGERSEPSSPSHCSSAMENCALEHPESSSADRSAGDGLYTPLIPYMDLPGFFPDVESRKEEFHAEPDPSPTSTPVDVFKKPRNARVSPASRSVSNSVLTLSSTSIAPSTSATALSANVVETQKRVTRSRSLFLRDGTNRGHVQSGGYEGNMVSGDGCLVSGGRVVRSERHESSSTRRNDSSLDQGSSSIVTMYEDISDDVDASSCSAKNSYTRPQSGSLIGPHVQEDSRIAPDPEKGKVRKEVIFPSKNVQSGDLSSYRVDPRSQSGVRCDVYIRKPGADVNGEGNVEIDGPNPTPTEANDSSANIFCFSSKPGSSLQRAEAPVDQPECGSNKSAPQRWKSMDGQSVALKKLGRDTVVFRRKAAFDVRSEMKQFCVPSATGVPGKDTEQSSKISNGNVPAAATTVLDQCQNDQPLFASDLTDQSEGPKREGIRKRIKGKVHLSDEKRHQCQLCVKEYGRADALKRHLRTHTGEKLFVCPTCKNGFSYSSVLKTHMRIHTGEKPYRCQECTKTYADLAALDGHARTHTGEKPYKCSDCCKTFKKTNSLRCHFRIHTGEKPYKCNWCAKKFSQRSNSFRHMKTHTRKPLKCNLCEQSFSLSKLKLMHHMRSHTDQKMYVCVCEKEFYIRSRLFSHMRVHTGEKPFNCIVCQKSFPEKRCCNRHLRKHWRKS